MRARVTQPSPGLLEIAKITGYSSQTVGNLIPEMLKDLLAFDPGIVEPGKPLGEIVRYASRNWEFFLDEAVRRHYMKM